MCDNAYALELLHLAGGFLREPVSRCGTSVISVSNIAINNAFIIVSIIFSFSNCKK